MSNARSNRPTPRVAARLPQLLAMACVFALAACGKTEPPPVAADTAPAAAPVAAPASATPPVDPNSSESITSQAGTTSVPGETPATPVAAAAAAPAGPITPIPKGEPVKVTPESIAAGKKLFVSIGCNACHGGTGGGGMCPPLTNSTWVYGSDDDTLRALITEGTLGMAGHGKKRVGVERVVGQMPPFGPVLKGEDIDHLVAFIHSINKTAGQAAK